MMMSPTADRLYVGSLLRTFLLASCCAFSLPLLAQSAQAVEQ